MISCFSLLSTKTSYQFILTDCFIYWQTMPNSAAYISSAWTLFPYGGTVWLCLACPSLWPPVWHAAVSAGVMPCWSDPSAPGWAGTRENSLESSMRKKGTGPGVWWGLASKNLLNYCPQTGPEHKRGCDGVSRMSSQYAFEKEYMFSLSSIGKKNIEIQFSSSQVSQHSMWRKKKTIKQCKQENIWCSL